MDSNLAQVNDMKQVKKPDSRFNRPIHHNRRASLAPERPHDF